MHAADGQGNETREKSTPLSRKSSLLGGSAATSARYSSVAGADAGGAVVAPKLMPAGAQRLADLRTVRTAICTDTCSKVGLGRGQLWCPPMQSQL